MTGGTVADLDISRCIRRALVRHWVDLGRLSMVVCRGMVLIRGSLRGLPGCEQQLNAQTVGALTDEIQRIRGVIRLAAELENWERSGVDGAWRPKGERKARPFGAPQPWSRKEDDKVYEI